MSSRSKSIIHSGRLRQGHLAGLNLRWLSAGPDFLAVGRNDPDHGKFGGAQILQQRSAARGVLNEDSVRMRTPRQLPLPDDHLPAQDGDLGAERGALDPRPFLCSGYFPAPVFCWVELSFAPATVLLLPGTTVRPVAPPAFGLFKLER